MQNRIYKYRHSLLSLGKAVEQNQMLCNKGIKMNQKGPHIPDLNCRFCTTNVPETQEYLEFYAGMELER